MLSAEPSQSPIHWECFCYRQSHQTGRRQLRSQVAIPYSSGMLLLPGAGTFTADEQAKSTVVAIPYSSGMLLLLPSLGRCIRYYVRGWSVAIPYSSGMLLLRGRPRTMREPTLEMSQSPIHRECFCYANSRVRVNLSSSSRSQSPIHRECFCYPIEEGNDGG